MCTGSTVKLGAEASLLRMSEGQGPNLWKIRAW